MSRIRAAAATLLGAALWGLGAGVAGAAAPEQSAAPTPAQAEFFEKHVRPVLAENCFSCHGPSQQMAGLRLDSRAGLLKGSENGPVVVPGDPAKSALIRAIGYSGSIKMPPPGKLASAAIEALTAWVRMGAPWPAVPEASAATPSGGYPITEAQRSHWAFQPVRQPALPAVKNRAWSISPVDRFILAKLEQKGLRPAPPADELTLLRRATFDLTGLPPTLAEIDAFLADHSPTAFARVVDRLLASPRYGERWGRHWLDVARYADTKGYSFNEDSHYPNAYTYRDYVIRAFNEDLPFNQFILQQLTADQLPLGTDKRPLAAMGFLTVGRRFLNSQPDIIDDRIDVVCRGLMGLTVGCARCHDHKFDPIPTKDYYSLYGVFASSIEPPPVDITPSAQSAPYYAQKARLDETEKEAAAITQAQQDRLLGQYRAQVGDYMLASLSDADAGAPKPEMPAGAAAPSGLNPLVLRRWRRYLHGREHDPIFGPWAEALSARSSAAGHGAAGAGQGVLIARRPPAAGGSINPLVARMLAGAPVASLADLAQRYGKLFATVDQRWRDLIAQSRIGAALAAKNGAQVPQMPTFLPDRAEEAVRQVLYEGGSPVNLKPEELEPYFEAAARDALKPLRAKAAQLRASMPPAPDYAMVMNDAPVPYNPHVFRRGKPGNPGDAVPRQFPLILAGANRKPFQHGSGRLDLARAIASPTNPLTARVIVNRVWLHHFGQGLVRTPSDFGMRSDPPTHSELLDYLAARFVETGWSIKKLQRLIMLSRTYQMSSNESMASRKLDPENLLLSHQNRRRLELEPLRDAMLAVSGRLDLTMGGPSVEITRPPYSDRRTVYGFIDRQNLPGLFRSFDLASPDASNAQRHETTVPQQALFMMNSPFVIEQARRVAAQPDVLAITDPARRIRYLYRLFFGRLPTPEEVSLGLGFVQAAPERQTANGPGGSAVALAAAPGPKVAPPGAAAPAPTPWEEYIHVLLMTNEFAFVD